MQIIIENCSSAGAHFSDNTNDVLMKISRWIKINEAPCLKFIDFRKRLQEEMRINDNNARNIYPLLKNCGFAEYAPGGVLDTSKFFTPEGTAYILGLESLRLIETGDYSAEQKRAASAEMNNVLHKLIYDALIRLLGNADLNYSEGMKWFVMFLLEYGKIDKNEFAYMVYQMNKGVEEWEEKTKEVIEGYRKGEISIEVMVRVRNDQKIQRETGETTRLEGISFFTAYSFYSALIMQAGLTIKDKGYHHLKSGAIEKARRLLEV